MSSESHNININNNNTDNDNKNSNTINNIWQVNKESHIEKIISNNKNKFVIVVFTYENNVLKSFLKKHMAIKFPECIFILAIIDLPSTTKKYNFIADKLTYINELKGKNLPFVFFYYNEKKILKIELVDMNIIEDTLNNLIIFINDQKINIFIDNKTNNKSIDNNTNMNDKNIIYDKDAYLYQIKKMAQRQKIHELEELQKLQIIKEMMENKDNNKYEKIDHMSE